MENLCELFFELSNEDRLRILHRLSSGPMNITNLSEKLDLTKQEVSRHMQRLNEAMLTEKSVDGPYHLTPYCKQVLIQLEELEFLSQHRNYFVSHSISRLPQEFIKRIGELRRSKYVDGISDAFYIRQQVVKEAEEYIWGITGGPTPPTTAILLVEEAIERKVKVKKMVELSTRVVSPRTIEVLDTEDMQTMIAAFERVMIDGLYEVRVVEQVGVYMTMSEKEVAYLTFPSVDERYDASLVGFTSTDEKSHGWCEDLFLHYWDRAEPYSEAVNRLDGCIRNRPGLIYALKAIAEGKELTYGKKSLSELEAKGLVKQGRLTFRGYFLYRNL